MRTLWFTIFFATAFTSAVAWAETVRENVIRNHDFHSDSRPAIRRFVLAQEAPDIIDSDWMYSEALKGSEPSGSIYPYQFTEIYEHQVDWLLIDDCVEFWHIPIEYDPSTDPEVLRKEDLLSQMYLTKQFLEFIEADDALRAEIEEVGIFSYEANDALRRAWLSGKLARPALVYGENECGGDLTGVEITIGFSAPTSSFKIISEFDYDLCERYGVDPWDSDQCSGVRDGVSTVLMLGGNYRVRISRASGEVIYKKFTIDSEGEEIQF